MTNLLTTIAVDGVRVSFDPTDLHHRVDDTRVGLRYITAFTQGHVLWSLCEAEMLAVLSLTVMKHSQATAFDYNESAAWTYSTQDLKAQVIHPTLSARSAAAWQKVDANKRETFALFLALRAGYDFGRFLTAGHFAQTGSPLSPSYDIDAHSALLAPTLARVDHEGLIAWVDARTSNEGTVR